MNQQIAHSIASSEVTLVRGIKLSVPELFQDPAFVEYVNSSPVMTWHDKKGPIAQEDVVDVAVFVDPSMTGEGTDSCMPYWDVIVEKLKAVTGSSPFGGNHYVVILSNC